MHLTCGMLARGARVGWQEDDVLRGIRGDYSDSGWEKLRVYSAMGQMCQGSFHRSEGDK